MSLLPVSYQRPGVSKLVGCLVYAVVAPFVALFLALFASLPLWIGTETLGLSKDLAGGLFLVLLLVSGVVVALWAYRDYRRRAALEVLIDRDVLWTMVGNRETAVRFDDVATIRLTPSGWDFACILLLRSGDTLMLPPEVAPFSGVRDDLDATLIPELVHRLNERLELGESVSLRMPALALLAPSTRALVSLIVGSCLLLSLWRFLLGIRLLGHAVLVLRHAWLGLRGGFVLERRGLRRSPESPLVPWDRLHLIRSDPLGLVLGSDEGKVFAVSLLTPDFWPALRWVNARLKRRGSAVS